MTQSSASAATARAAYESIDTRGSIEDDDPHRLIELLLDAALARIAKAKGAVSAGQIAERGEAIGETITILATLRDSLNMTQGGALAQNLDDLYDYMQRRLMVASAQSNIPVLDEIASLLHELNDAWKQIPQDVRVRAQ